MRTFTLILIAYILVVVGCSGSNTPVSLGNSALSQDNQPIFGLTDTGDILSAVGLLGAFDLTINPNDLTADLVSKRINTIGESYIVSGIGFFTMTPCSNCLQLAQLTLTPDGDISISFYIKHPFEKGDPGGEPTAVNRLDLDVFDLAMVIVPREITPTTFSLTGKSIYTDILINPAGYTTELANVLDDTSACPYALVIDESGATSHSWNLFAMGQSTEFDTVFNLSSGSSLLFSMYLTMGYGASAKKPQRLDPKYYNPEFNRKAAWKVNVIPPEGDDPPEKGNTWDNKDSSTFYNVQVEVYDWQTGATVYGTPADFANAPENNVYAASEVASVSVDIPGMNNTLPSVTSETSGTGMPTNPLIFNVPVANTNLIAAGMYTGLVRVLDERPCLTIPDGRDIIIDAPDGVNLTNYVMVEYATYQTFTATVVYGCGPISGSIISPDCPVTGLMNGQTVDFVVVASSENNGNPIVYYEVDFNYDGMDFNVDDSNTDGIFTDVGPFDVPDYCEDNIPCDFTVAFRATDSCNLPNTTIFATCMVTVNYCLEPVGNVKLKVNRTNATYGYPFYHPAPWTLEWEPAVGAVQYVIFYDTDAGDFSDPSAYTDNLTYVGSVYAGNDPVTFNVPSSHLNSDRWNCNNGENGYTYIVRSRAVIGSPLYESENSEPAFIMYNGWDSMSVSYPYPIIGQFGNEGEGWQAGIHGSNYNPNHCYWYPFIYDRYAASGSNAASPIGEEIGTIAPDYPGFHSCTTIETPTNVPDSQVRFIDFTAYINGHWAPSEGHGRHGGMIIGTCSIRPSTNWNNPETTFEWALAADETLGGTIPFSSYTHYVPLVTTSFKDVDGPENCWAWSRTLQDPVWYHTGKRLGGDVNATANPNDPYIGIAACKDDSYYAPGLYTDDIAIMIY